MEQAVFVVAWEYGSPEGGGGGGFEWYYARADAEEAWRKEKENEVKCGDGWTAYYVEIDGVDTTDPDKATAEIDSMLWDFLPDDRPLREV